MIFKLNFGMSMLDCLRVFPYSVLVCSRMGKFNHQFMSIRMFYRILGRVNRRWVSTLLLSCRTSVDNDVPHDSKIFVLGDTQSYHTICVNERRIVWTTACVSLLITGVKANILALRYMHPIIFQDIPVIVPYLLAQCDAQILSVLDLNFIPVWASTSLSY